MTRTSKTQVWSREEELQSSVVLLRGLGRDVIDREVSEKEEDRESLSRVRGLGAPSVRLYWIESSDLLCSIAKLEEDHWCRSSENLCWSWATAEIVRVG